MWWWFFVNCNTNVSCARTPCCAVCYFMNAGQQQECVHRHVCKRYWETITGTEIVGVEKSFDRFGSLMFTERQPSRIKTIAKVLIKYQHHLIQHQQPSDTHAKKQHWLCFKRERNNFWASKGWTGDALADIYRHYL